MEIVKKNILSVICGVVALLALVGLQWPVNGMYDDTKAQLVERKGAYDKLHQLRTAQRQWPALPDLSSAPPQRLDHFPNETTLKKGDSIRDAVQAQAKEMKSRTAVNNEHQPLAPGILPTPGENRYQFEAPYRKKVSPKGIAEFMSSALPPTDEEVHAEALRLYNTDYAPRIIQVAGKPVNKAQIDEDWKAAAAKLQSKMRLDRAKNCKIYLNPSVIPNSLGIFNNPQGPRESEIWYAQMQVWLEDDVLGAIRRINENAGDVTESPVKELVSLMVPGDKSMYVLGNNSAPPEPNFARGITGRASNALYDVIHFDMAINVDARKVPFIIAEMQKGQLITITHVNLSAVDGVVAAHDGFFYGDVPVVRLNLQVEDLYLREWTSKLMPDVVKQELGAPVNSLPPGMNR